MAKNPSIAWRTTLKRRLAVVAAVFLAWTAAIEARLVYLQVLHHDDLMARAERQQMRTVAAPAKRGEILDRTGRVLAYSVDAESIYAVPTDIDDPVKAARALCGALADCTPKERQALAERIDRGRAFVYVRRQVSPDQARRVSELDLEGVGFMKENRRFYPNKDLAAHVLGYVGLDNTGLSGIEGTYDTLIKGRPGTVLIQTDARRHAFSRTEKLPTAGASLELTIDEYLQHVVERELRAGVEENRADGGTAVVMDPQTGEILALANYPTFNPNAYRQSPEATRRNRAIQDLYEPGSTFKIVTASAALEQELVQPDDMVNVSGGTIRFGSRVIRDTHDYGVLSFTDVIVKSSNVGAIKIGFKVGTERLSRYVRAYGFGKAISPDFPGESSGIVWRSSEWTDSALASVSMGYQVGVTPLQMVTAVSAVANGGQLVEPRVVGAVYRNELRYPVRPKILRRVIDTDTAAALTSIMEGVTEHGTAKAAKIDGYTIAGKTGTAAKLVDGRYSKRDYNASFVGFLPSRNPVLAMIVVIDSPHAGTYYGGTVAAPIFKRIAEGALRHLGIAPTIDPPPAVIVARAAAPSVPQFQPTVVQTAPSDVVPDVAGMSAREATQALARVGLSPRLTGDGFVIGQTPAAGGPLQRGSDVRLVLGRLQARRETEGTPKP